MKDDIMHGNKETDCSKRRGAVVTGCMSRLCILSSTCGQSQNNPQRTYIVQKYLFNSHPGKNIVPDKTTRPNRTQIHSIPPI